MNATATSVRLTALISCVFPCAVTVLMGEETQKIIDFRDGTIIKVTMPDVDLPWRRIAEDGEVTQEPLKLSRVEQLKFVLTPATEQVAEVRRMVVQLGDADYHKREVAHKQLLLRGGKFRKILEQMLPRSKDYEVKWRLAKILEKLPEGESLVGNDYDRLLIKGREDEVHGDVGRWSLEIAYRGATIVIDRSSVLAIRDAPLGLDLSAEPTVVHMDRIVRDDDAHFPKDVIRVDFDKAPGGESLANGTDISEVYVPVGCLFETSIKESFVGIQPYDVGGRSRGKCAATNKPLYQGVITIRFCKPGNARLPAGVRYVGFWTSHVAPDGTSLQAFDARDRKIAEIKTTKHQRDFLALTTNVPIAHVKVVPDVEIDPDYAIDDLVFDPPRPLSEAGDPDRYSVLLATGERLYSQRLKRTGDTVTLGKLTVGAEKVDLKSEEIAVLVPPRLPLPEVEDHRCFVRLDDGSVLRAETTGGLKLSRFSQAVQAERLVALWGATTHLEEPPADAWQQDAALLVAEGSPPKPLQQWTLGKTWIESKELDSDGVRTYANSPSIWFHKPGKRPAGSGLLRTRSGEEIVLDKTRRYHLKSWGDDGVVVAEGDQQWTIPLGDVSSLLMPKKNLGEK